MPKDEIEEPKLLPHSLLAGPARQQLADDDDDGQP